MKSILRRSLGRFNRKNVKNETVQVCAELIQRIGYETQPLTLL